MRLLFLFITVYSTSAEFNDDSVEKTEEFGTELGERIFGFAESTQGCSRPPKTQIEILIGDTFYLLCKHFDPQTRDRIIKTVSLSNSDDENDENSSEIFDNCLEIMKPEFMSCFKWVFDAYDLAGIESPPECLKNLAIFPNNNLKLFWLKKFNLVIKYIEQIIIGYKKFNPAREIIEKYLEQGILKRWKKFKLFSYAKMKITAWNSSEIKDKNERLHKILKDPPSLIQICTLTKEWLDRPTDFKANNCLRQIMGNILIFEQFLQQQGVTLETEFMDNDELLLIHLLHITKSVLGRQQVPSRRFLSSKFKKKSPYEAAVKLQEIKAVNVKCMDELREKYDKEKTGKISKLLHEKHLQQCLDSFVNKTESAGESAKKIIMKTIHADKQEDVTHAEKKLIKSVMLSYRRLKPLQPTIDNIVEQGISNDISRYPWANNVINNYQKSTIPNKYAKLENAVRSSSYSMSSSTSCKKIPGMRKNNCWSNYIQQNAIVENKLNKDGISLEYLYLGDPFKMNLIYSIDQSLKKKERGRGRIISQYRIALDPEVQVDGKLLDSLAEDQFDGPDDFKNTTDIELLINDEDNKDNDDLEAVKARGLWDPFASI
ncbi:uncharacterized protein LOC130671747 [Microplitis mediator]|uniref:uncharacterized protein LOC130671747 n=1 Tax=Microplitis mediator TaxID=375433 RepID=UPI002555AB29|nr:uncharacterized protein LOC130671747 [Microplitis mediator]